MATGPYLSKICILKFGGQIRTGWRYRDDVYITCAHGRLGEIDVWFPEDQASTGYLKCKGFVTAHPAYRASNGFGDLGENDIAIVRITSGNPPAASPLETMAVTQSNEIRFRFPKIFGYFQNDSRKMLRKVKTPNAITAHDLVNIVYHAKSDIGVSGAPLIIDGNVVAMHLARGVRQDQIDQSAFPSPVGYELSGGILMTSEIIGWIESET